MPIYSIHTASRTCRDNNQTVLKTQMSKVKSQNETPNPKYETIPNNQIQIPKRHDIVLHK